MLSAINQLSSGITGAVFQASVWPAVITLWVKAAMDHTGLVVVWLNTSQ